MFTKQPQIIEGEGRYRWKELPEIDIDNHVIIVPEEGNEDEDNQVYINEYLVALPSLWPLKRETPPWEVHVLPPRRRSLVMRFHHTLGDCVSLLAVLLSGCDIADEILPLRSGEKISFLGRAWRAVKGARYTIGYVIEHSMHAVRRKEDMPLIPREDGLERSPRKLASLSLSLEDMKAVKNKLDAVRLPFYTKLLDFMAIMALPIWARNWTTGEERERNSTWAEGDGFFF